VSSTREEIRSSIEALASADLANAILIEYDELTRRFDLRDFQPSELNGGRFAEAAFRICQQVCTSGSTAIGRTLPGVDQLLRTLEQTPSKGIDDTFRLHIPRTLRLIYDLRNKRDVAHLGAGVSPNYADAALVLNCASWVLAEVVRVSHKCDVQTAQVIVDNLAERRTSLIWEENEVIRVLRPGLPYRDQVLLILHHLQPNWVDDHKLFKWVEYSTLTAFRKNVLTKLHKDAEIFYKDQTAKILPPGNTYVENTLVPSLSAGT
jgi:hypothetical protein